MIVSLFSLLFSSVPLIGLSLGDDSTTSASDDVTTPDEGYYTVYAPGYNPTYGLDDTVTFSWNATGFDTALYYCHSAAPSMDESVYATWVFSSSYELSSGEGRVVQSFDRSFHANHTDFLASTTSGFTTYEVSSLGQSLSQDNFTDWPATCFFGMRMRGSSESGGGIFYVKAETTSIPSTSVISPIPAPGATTVFVTATSTASSGSTVQQTATAIQPPPIETIPESIPEPENDHDLSGGAKAGIAIGSVSGAFSRDDCTGCDSGNE